MLTVLCWRWSAPGGPDFGPEYVNRLKAGLARHLHIDHQIVCVTDNPAGIDLDVRCLPITAYQNTPRCRRRMKQFDQDFARTLGTRILAVDLDMVFVGDITSLVQRPEPIVCWRVGYANVYSGSFILYDADALDGVWQLFQHEPEGFPARVQPKGVASDQAMLNWYIGRRRIRVGEWTERDGLVTYFGEGYEKFAHLGVGPSQPTLPAGARVVVLGSADKSVMDAGQFPWIQTHWSELEAVA